MKIRKSLTLLALVALLATVPTPAIALDSQQQAVAKLVEVSESCELAVERYQDVSGCESGIYLVKFQDYSAQGQFEHYLRSDLSASLQGDAVSAFVLSPLELASISREPKVVSIAANIEMQGLGTQSAPGWHLDRIDQAALPLNQTYNFPDDARGAGVVVYIVDTGINTTHSEFTGRIGSGFSAIGAASEVEDCNGHGTHVAGLAGGTNFGPAKLATITPVRVLDCSGSGTLLSVLTGLDWIARNTLVGAKAVVNMSLGGNQNAFLDNAVASLTAQGLVFVVAAGNSTADACNTSPARVPAAITVASSEISDTFSSFSNFGTCVDVVAPGGALRSAWIGGPNASAVGSGTSMASGLVAGLVANQMSFGYQTVPALSNAMTTTAISAALTAVPAGTPNLLVRNTIAFSSVGAAPTGTQPNISVPQDSTPVSVAPITNPTVPGAPGGVPLPPPTPVAPTVQTSGSSATVSWVLPVQEGLLITSQTLRINSGSTVVLEVPLGALVTSHVFENMASGVIYTAQIALTNATGIGPFSLSSAGFSYQQLLDSPDAGEFSAWTKMLANGKQVKFYVKYPQVGQKIQFLVQRNNGSYRELAWIRIRQSDLSESGEYRNLTNGIYFVRTVNLSVGKNRMRILVDGQILGSTRTYSLRG